MRKIDLGQSIAVLANLGVIAGIAFLALEVRQNNELMAADARLNRANMVRATWGRVVDNPELASLVVRDRQEEPLTEQEELILNAYWMETLYSVQWQYQEGLTSNLLRAMQRNFESYGSLRRAWQGGSRGSRAAGKDNFDEDFVRFLEETMPALSDSMR